jgi:ketosteroid isomerase-like protein
MKQSLWTAIAALGIGAVTATAALAQATPYPDIADVSHATQAAAAYFKAYFTAKSLHDPKTMVPLFNKDQVTYIDATLGWPFYDYKSVDGVFETFMPKWPPSGKSYPTWIMGDTHSALVGFTDTPELFGGEIRILAAIDFKDGKIARWVDYWDGRSFGAALAAKMRTPADKFPTEFSVKVTGENASAKMQETARKLAAAFAGANAKEAAAMFSYDAVYEDMALRARVAGLAAIERYLGRTLAKLPYGVGAAVRHVVGSDQGGGYEWTAPGAVKRGIIALELGPDGKITRLRATWDNAMMSDAELKNLVLLSVEQ